MQILGSKPISKPSSNPSLNLSQTLLQTGSRTSRCPQEPPNCYHEAPMATFYFRIFTHMLLRLRLRTFSHAYIRQLSVSSRINTFFPTLMRLLQKEPIILFESHISSWPSFLAKARWMQSTLFIDDLMCLVNTTSGARTLPRIRFC